MRGEGMQTFSIIAAATANFVIGRDGKIPWRLPEDLRRFKARTVGHAVIMGRNTWESLPRRPLPARRNIVVSSTLQDAEGAEVVRSLDEGLALAWEQDDNPFVVGGSRLYAEALAHPQARSLYLTRIVAEIAGDAFFPSEALAPWKAKGGVYYQPADAKGWRMKTFGDFGRCALGERDETPWGDSVWVHFQTWGK